MSETLLSPSKILLYGRLLDDLTYNESGETNLGDNHFLRNQLNTGDCGFARIYGFAYEGHYYDLARPTIFLVHGEGSPAERAAGERRPDARLARAPADTDQTGVATQYGSFSEDILVWAYDKGDFSIRLEVETGMLEQLLLEAELISDALPTHYSGAKMSGAKVSGAKVSGAKVSGAKVSGAKVSGGRGNFGD